MKVMASILTILACASCFGQSTMASLGISRDDIDSVVIEHQSAVVKNKNGRVVYTYYIPQTTEDRSDNDHGPTTKGDIRPLAVCMHGDTIYLFVLDRVVDLKRANDEPVYNAYDPEALHLPVHAYVLALPSSTFDAKYETACDVSYFLELAKQEFPNNDPKDSSFVKLFDDKIVENIKEIRDERDQNKQDRNLFKPEVDQKLTDNLNERILRALNGAIERFGTCMYTSALFRDQPLTQFESEFVRATIDKPASFFSDEQLVMQRRAVNRMLMDRALNYTLLEKNQSGGQDYFYGWNFFIKQSSDLHLKASLGSISHYTARFVAASGGTKEHIGLFCYDDEVGSLSL